MRAQKWRDILIGNREIVKNLRKTKLINVDELKLKPSDEMDLKRDLTRTYPTHAFFKDNLHTLSTIIQWYCHTNRGMGYFQGLCFMTFPLYYVFYKDDPEHAQEDTFYAVHKFIQVIRPCIPIASNEPATLEFNDTIAKLVLLELGSKSLKLQRKFLDGPWDIVIPTLVVQLIPSMFANRFSLDEVLILWDYIIEGGANHMLGKVVNIITAMVLQLEQVYLHLEFDKALTLMQCPENYNVYKIIITAKSL